MKSITSQTNGAISQIKKLGRARDRRQAGLFVAEGIRTCNTLFESGVHVHMMYVTEDMFDLMVSTIPEEVITVVTPPIMKKISDTVTPSGVLGVFVIPTSAKQAITGGLVLANVSDPGNMGTLIRTAAAIGKQLTVVVVGGVDPWSSKVVRATAGTIGLVNLMQLTWEQLLERKGDISLYALTPSGGKHLSDIVPAKSLLVVGSEAHGIPDAWQQTCDGRVTLSMSGNVESLNAGVAGSIALYTAHMQR